MAQCYADGGAPRVLAAGDDIDQQMRDYVVKKLIKGEWPCLLLPVVVAANSEELTFVPQR